MKSNFEKVIALSRIIQNRFIIKSLIIQDLSCAKYKEEYNKALIEADNSGRKLPIRFVIFNFPRSGSNMLCSMLNSHPEIICHGELFNPDKIYFSKDFYSLLDINEDFYRLFYSSKKEVLYKDLTNSSASIIAKRNHSPENFIFKIWQLSFGNNAVGFNLFPSHIPNAAESLVKDKQVRKILLLRRNKIKCYVSLMVARKTGVWDLYNPVQHKNDSDIQVTVNSEHLKTWSKNYDLYFNSMRLKLTELEQPFLELNYEDLVDSNSELVKSDLLQFLKVSVQPKYLQSALEKQGSNNLEKKISNFNDLKNKLKNTELEPLLYE